jgi:hypothetical protein
MESSGEGEWLQRRFHSAVRACFVAGAPDEAPQATFTSLRAEHWTRLGDVIPEDAYTLHLNRRSATVFPGPASLQRRATGLQDCPEAPFLHENDTKHRCVSMGC